MATVFVDSTTLLYTLDPGERLKQPIAKAWLRTLRTANLLMTSPQVLNESYWAASRKAAFASARPSLQGTLLAFAPWATAPLDVRVLEEGWRLMERYRTGFWDSLLLASANIAGCNHFLSEDLSDGQAYGSVTVVDPFRHAPEDVLGRALRS